MSLDKLQKFGRVWTILDEFGRVWSKLMIFQILAQVEDFQPILILKTSLAQYNLLMIFLILAKNEDFSKFKIFENLIKIEDFLNFGQNFVKVKDF